MARQNQKRQPSSPHRAKSCPERSEGRLLLAAKGCGERRQALPRLSTQKTGARSALRHKDELPASDDPLGTTGVTTLAEAADRPWFPTSQRRYERDGGEARSTDRRGAGYVASCSAGTRQRSACTTGIRSAQGRACQSASRKFRHSSGGSDRRNQVADAFTTSPLFRASFDSAMFFLLVKLRLCYGA